MMSERKTPDGRDRHRIAFEADVNPRSVERAYRGEATRSTTWRRVAASAEKLGYGPPPTRVAPAGEVATAELRVDDALEQQARRLVADPPPRLARMWKAAMTPAAERLPWAFAIAEKAHKGEAWALEIVAHLVTR